MGRPPKSKQGRRALSWQVSGTRKRKIRGENQKHRVDLSKKAIMGKPSSRIITLLDWMVLANQRWGMFLPLVI